VAAGPEQPGARDPARPSFYVHNPWRKYSAVGFAGSSMMLTVTTIFYALGRLPLPLVGISVLLALGVFGFGLYARRRAARFDAEVIAGLRR
jgi:hypothetical protein